jgi:hypothetical protein
MVDIGGEKGRREGEESEGKKGEKERRKRSPTRIAG